METRTLEDKGGKPGWMRARLDENKIVLDGGPKGGQAINGVVLKTKDEVRAFINYLDSAKNTYGIVPQPSILKRVLRTRLRLMARTGWCILQSYNKGENDWQNRIDVGFGDLDRFIHDLMHLAWMMQPAP